MKIVFLILAALMFGYAAYLFLIQFKIHEPESKLTVKCIIALQFQYCYLYFFTLNCKKAFLQYIQIINNIRCNHKNKSMIASYFLCLK